jgi:hypothetical protein
MAGRDGLGRRALVALVAALALAIVPAACGDDDDEGGTEETASAEEVTVTTSDTEDGYTWDVSATPTADTQSVTIENESEEPHELVLARINEGYTVDEAYELQGRKGSAELLAQTGAKPGDSSTTEVRGSIEAGNYAMLCPIAGKDGPHYQRGQLEEFSIE